MTYSVDKIIVKLSTFNCLTVGVTADVNVALICQKRTTC